VGFYSPCHRVQTAIGAHQASYLPGTGGSFSEGRCESDNTPPASPEVKNTWNHISTTPNFMAWYLIKQWIRYHAVVLV